MLKELELQVRFGDQGYGGIYSSESLIAVLAEVETSFREAMADRKFVDQFEELLRTFAGRATPVMFAERLSDKYGRTIFLKREDLLHGGAHKTNSTIGQLLLAKYMGKTRVIAETGAGQHGVATAMTGAKLGLPVEVYMGAVDIERQRTNVKRMELFGAQVHSVASGGGILKDAINEAMRDWITNVGDTYHCFGTAAGPYPYPSMVKYFQSVIGHEARAQIIEMTGKLPTAVFACIGGGSNAVGIFSAFEDDGDVRLFGAEPAGVGNDSDRHAATLTKGSPGVFHGMHSLFLQNTEGQIANTHSIAAGLDYPGVGPELAAMRDSGRATFGAVTDEETLRAFAELSALEGIIPAFESAHALALATRTAGDLDPDAALLVCVSGRGDKDLDEYWHYLGSLSA
ncbi:tryptophan synthase subunit beta [Actinokineospora xionganensis]|uniref:Tryptophan synthase beta chain n=1 Tax=Actinokineospora xionganensis TaxID=2684470 RepID=A0ABR7L8W4_9PSEU|nr:tryptophan synthase subunit beta [Actinokineospora xionganensis]MBC6449117.1 tryptophan synthase subunit beta [Actinokineospora xionganensis]